MYEKKTTYAQATFYMDNLKHWKIPYEWKIDNGDNHYIQIRQVEPTNIHLLCSIFLPKEDIDYQTYGSDLYIRVTDESRKLMAELQPKSLLSTFTDNIDKVKWYDLPFCRDLRLLPKDHPDVKRIMQNR